jgi:hypothetical protein
MAKRNKKSGVYEIVNDAYKYRAKCRRDTVMEMRDIINLIEDETVPKIIPVLYHGTCPDNAESLISNGWQPRSGMRGGNLGQTRYLYLTTGEENALWYAGEKGCDTLVAVVNVPLDYLDVDPEDGTYDSATEEISKSQKSGCPGNLVLKRSLSAEHFKISSQDVFSWKCKEEEID